MSLRERIDLRHPVLVVEDEAFIATQIEELLGEMGFEAVELCLSFEDAQARLADEWFQLVIFDINVGGKMSFGLISAAVTCGSAVVTVSGYLPAQEGLGDTVFLKKPVHGDELADAISYAAVKAGLRGVERRQPYVAKL